MKSYPLTPGLSSLAESYDCYIIDLWGVMHDGVQVFPRALDCLRRLKERSARIIILSNAPRRVVEVTARNQVLGLESDLADFVMSSGELTWRHLEKRSGPFYSRLGKSCFYLGPERDLAICDGLGLEVTEDLEKADFILLTGPREQGDRLEDYSDVLQRALELKLPMICANPDYVVIRDGVSEICAGAIAKKYEDLGGELRCYGKPQREIYDLCLQALDVTERSRVLAVGDSLRTDIQGAKGAGVDALFIAGGIHGEELGMLGGAAPNAGKLSALIEGAPAKPDFVMSEFFW